MTAQASIDAERLKLQLTAGQELKWKRHTAQKNWHYLKI